jgi:hypothetical protein
LLPPPLLRAPLAPLLPPWDRGPRRASSFCVDAMSYCLLRLA